jgi:hypothetical protein
LAHTRPVVGKRQTCPLEGSHPGAMIPENTIAFSSEVDTGSREEKRVKTKD